MTPVHDSAAEEITPAADRQSPARLMRILMGFAGSQMLLTAHELGVFELLAGGGRTAAALAAELEVDESALERLLIAGCTLDFFRRDGDVFTITDFSRAHLVRSSPAYMGGVFGHVKNELYPLWQHLESAVREGQPQWSKVPGMDPKGPFESMYQTEAGVRMFMDAMFAATYPSALEFAEAFDFSRFERIVDVGGASGAFFAAVLPKFPSVRGTIFDLAPVGPVAMETMQRFGLDGRVTFQAGDFFKDPLPAGADMYVLGYILHDWNREQGTSLLKKIHDALPKDGAVFICETLLNESKDGPLHGAFSNLNMLVATYGKEHTPGEYQEWLTETGFCDIEYRFCRGPKSYIVGWKR